MSKKINLLGDKDNFFFALKDRLERAGASFTDEPEEADLTVGLGKRALDELVDVAIIAVNEDSRRGNFDEIKNAGLIIRIHDLLIPEGGQGWRPVDVEEWVDLIRGGSIDLTPDIKPQYWFHIRDATDAVSLLVMADTDAFAQGVVDLCGRRAWGPDEDVRSDPSEEVRRPDAGVGRLLWLRLGGPDGGRAVQRTTGS